MAAEYIDKALVTGKPIDEVEKKSLVEGAKKAHRNVLKKAGDYGTLLHEAIERYIKTQKVETFTSKVLQKGYSDFLDWQEKNDVIFKASEKKIYSRSANYAGTFDFIAKINGEYVLGDLKTSSGIWDEYRLQLAAYRYAFQEEFPKVKIEQTVIIRCGKNGVFETARYSTFKKDTTAFLAALNLYNWQKSIKLD